MQIPAGNYKVTILFSTKVNELQMGNITVVVKIWKIA
jgi:hypothetical protein